MLVFVGEIGGTVWVLYGEDKFTWDALMVGITADACAYILIELATHGWMAFALMPLFCLGGIGAPALQALLPGSVGPISKASCRVCWPAPPAWPT